MLASVNVFALAHLLVAHVSWFMFKFEVVNGDLSCLMHLGSQSSVLQLVLQPPSLLSAAAMAQQSAIQMAFQTIAGGLHVYNMFLTLYSSANLCLMFWFARQ